MMGGSAATVLARKRAALRGERGSAASGADVADVLCCIREEEDE